MSQQVINEHYMPDMKSYGNKFIRRSDLTASIRLSIAVTAFMAKVNGSWGKISELAWQYTISRTFVYLLLYKLERTSVIIFGDNRSKAAVIDHRLPYSYMLSLRMEGRCSIEAISSIMKRFGKKNSSVGSISEFLQYIGLLLPNTLSIGNEIQFVIFLCDEIFSKSIPILVTVEPNSSAILRIELADSRKAEDWKKHWKCLEKNGYYAIYLVSDEGKGICTAKKEALADIIRQADTYHAIAHQLGKWVDILEKAAYKAIEEEYNRYDRLDSARSDPVINKGIDKYIKAKKIAKEKIQLYEDYHFLYKCLIEELKIFDNNGNLRDRKQAEATITTGLDLIETLGNAKLTKVVNKVRRTMPEVFNYFDIAKSIVADLGALSIDQEALRALCLAWQCRKGVTKSKKAKTKQYWSMMERFYLELAADYLQEDYDLIKVQVDMKLDQIVQSSSLVECINSIIRPYLNSSKNHVNQGMLNLIMYYHNHRRYIGGRKRKGKTPIEILTGRKQEKDWIELIFDIVEEKNPSFFACCR
jgi:hypothetical protein